MSFNGKLQMKFFSSPRLSLSHSLSFAPLLTHILRFYWLKMYPAELRDLFGKTKNGKKMSVCLREDKSG